MLLLRKQSVLVVYIAMMIERGRLFVVASSEHLINVDGLMAFKQGLFSPLLRNQIDPLLRG